MIGAFDLGSAHLVGRSMGGGIAMLAALDYPDLVSSLTLVGTSPGGSDLPPMSEEFLSYVGGVPDWSDREAVIDHVIGLLRVFSGGSRHFDEATVRDLVGRDVDRTVNITSSLTNHFIIDVGELFRNRLGEISAPTLVVHGAEDPVFPLGHALALGCPGRPGMSLSPPSCGIRRAASDATRNHVSTAAPERRRSESPAGSIPGRATGCSCPGRETTGGTRGDHLMSLSGYKVAAATAVSDMGRAREFVYLSPEHAGKSTATLAGWGVEDVESVVDDLTSKGIVFERYDEGPIITDGKGIATFDGGAKVAYFKDPDGNTLSIAQAPRS